MSFSKASGRDLGLLAVASHWGLFWGGWAVLIPEFKDAFELSDQGLGLALFAVPVAAVPAMIATGRLARRLERHTLPAVTAAFAVAALLVALAPSLPVFVVSLAVVGGTSGAIEVGLNATLAAREARDGRRLFNKVHAATPLAMVLAAPAVGLAIELGASAQAVLLTLTVLGAVSAVLAIDPGHWPDPASREAPRKAGRRLPEWLVLAGGVCAIVLLMENAVEQWGAIYLKQEFAAGPLIASLAPAAYMTGLSAGRILAHWRGHLLGDRWLVLAGGVLGGTGIGLAVLAPHPALACAGFGLAGTGLAPVMPTLFAAVGRASRPERRSGAISMITTVSYTGFLASPPMVGLMAGWYGLPAAFSLVALGALPVAAGSWVVRRLPRETEAMSRSRRSSDE